MHKLVLRRPIHRTTIPRRHSFNGGRRMPLDVAADDEAYMVLADVPGLSAEDVEITLEKEVLTLRTDPVSEESDERDSLWRERPMGGIERRIRLPEAVDHEGIEAWVENGVLTVRLPKMEQERTRRIEVSAR